MLEHLVVAKAGKADKLAQAELDDILRYGAKELFAEDEDEQQQAATGTADGAAAGSAAAADGVDSAAAAAAAGEGEGDGGKAAAGAGHGKSALRIVWDDAALERLLDRRQVEAAAAAAAAGDEAAAAAEEDEFTKAFKVRAEVGWGPGGGSPGCRPSFQPVQCAALRWANYGGKLDSCVGRSWDTHVLHGHTASLNVRMLQTY